MIKEKMKVDNEKELKIIIKILKNYARNNMENLVLSKLYKKYNIDLESNFEIFNTNKIKKYIKENKEMLFNLKSQKEIVSDINKELNERGIKSYIIKSKKEILNMDGVVLNDLKYHFLKVQLNRKLV